MLMELKQRPLFLYDKLLWDIAYADDTGKTYSFTIYGPFCPRCKYKLIDGKHVQEYWCRNCDKYFKLSDPHDVTMAFITDEYCSKRRAIRDVISLDLPPTKVEAYNQDENYFVSARLTQKEGRRMLVVYVGERKNKQDSKDYSQIFVDLDQEQIRYDTSNKMPSELLATLVGEFKGAMGSLKFKK